jgi:hypothetical protein
MKKKTLEPSETPSFRSVEEAKAGIQKAYADAEEFLRAVFIVGCHRLPWASFGSIGSYEGEEADLHEKMKSVRTNKAGQLREAIVNLETSYQIAKSALPSVLPLLEYGFAELGPFEGAAQAFDESGPAL